MGSIKETFLNKYGIYEYIFLVMGVLILGTLTYWFMTKELEYSMGEGIALVVGVFAVGAPLSLLEWGRKKIGIETREKKAFDEKFQSKTGFDPNREA